MNRCILTSLGYKPAILNSYTCPDLLPFLYRPLIFPSSKCVPSAWDVAKVSACFMHTVVTGFPCRIPAGGGSEGTGICHLCLPLRSSLSSSSNGLFSMEQDVPHIFGPRDSKPHDLPLVADGLQEEKLA